MKENTESEYQYFKDKRDSEGNKYLLEEFSAGSKVQVRDASPKQMLSGATSYFPKESLFIFFFFSRQNELNSFYENLNVFGLLILANLMHCSINLKKAPQY